MSNTVSPNGQSRARLRVVRPGSALEQTDTALVRAVRDGSQIAAIQVWERYSVLMRRILQRTLGPSVDVEDMVQETFLRLFRDIETLHKPSALRSFLVGIALHVATSELRRRRVRRWITLSDDGIVPDPDSSTDAQRLEEREALRRLYHLLDRLDTRRRLVFVMRYIEGVELAELSVIMGCSLATIKRRIADASRRVSLLAAKDPVLAPYITRTT